MNSIIKYCYKTIMVLGIVSLCACKKEAKVSWISSTNDQRWKQKEEAFIQELDESTNYSAEIFTNEQEQVIDGFGGCFNELGYTALSLLPDEKQDSILQAVFDKESGHKFNICRMPLGANDYSIDFYSHNETAGDFEMAKFSIDRDRKYLIPYIKRALQINPKLQIWASPWCPPSWMKTNDHYACRMAEVNDLCCKEKEGQEGVTQFKMDEKTLSAYALYFSKFLKSYDEEGINIYAVHVQNEPNSCQNFPSCVWKASDLNTFIGKYLGPKLEADHKGTEIWLGTIERPSVENVDTVVTDSASSKYITGVGFQWAGKGAIPGVNEKYPDLKLMQTETECGDGSNDWKAAEYTFDLMKHYFNNGANSYMYWNIILDETGKSQWGWKQNSMISVDKSSKKVTFNPEYHLMKHFSYFIKPGAKKLKSSGEFSDVLAFQNPDNSIVIIAGNKDEAEKEVSLKIGEKALTAKLAGKSFNTFVL